MTIAMIMSRDRLEQEHAMLNRLTVGLINDGNRVLRVIPTSQSKDLPSYEKNISLANRICIPMPTPWTLKKNCKEDLVSKFEKSNVSTVVSFGKDAQKIALDLSSTLDIKLLSEVISMKDALRTKSSSPIWRWLATTPSFEQAISKRVGSDRVSLVPLGVTSSKRVDDFENTKRKCVCILDSTGNIKNTRSILEALSAIREIHIFIELVGKKQHKVWRDVKDLKMLDRVTFLRDVGDLRSLITQTNLVILPSKTMPLRTVLLESMQSGVPVVATNIDGFDMLVDEETSLITVDDWESPVQKMINDRDFANSIGLAGASLISKHYGSATQIAAFEAASSLI
ncbi:MAG: glycosyltransferase family 4 protein [Phycisphaerales bacterium]|jgi:glycosyltransferase involved in cell wall biosynthesis|nr:glycosyltransferase family 4 protein [Phycisphaerales bacterium]